MLTSSESSFLPPPVTRHALQRLNLCQTVYDSSGFVITTSLMSYKKKRKKEQARILKHIICTKKLLSILIRKHSELNVLASVPERDYLFSSAWQAAVDRGSRKFCHNDRISAKTRNHTMKSNLTRPQSFDFISCNCLKL